ncbi:MAG: AAA family ATPase [Chitinophagales bacterium]
MKALALSNSDFKRLRTTDMLYVDKTQEIQRLLEDKGTYYFLARPRRFGKSLFISTLEAFFEGKKELFEGLYIYDKIDWEKHGNYPVIRLNFSLIKSGGSKAEFEESIIDYLENFYAIPYNFDRRYNNIKTYFFALVTHIYRQTGKQIILLIDEYDKPITDHIADDKRIEDNQEIMRDFYDTIKNLPGYWRMVFITGISKFARVSVFSVLNNLTDLSEHDPFHAILGFTRSEIEHYFAPHLQAFAEKEGKTVAELLDYLQFWYDGYSWDGIHRIYNPYSVLSALYYQKIEGYWYGSGTPKLLVDFILHRTYHKNTPINKNAKSYENLRVESEFFKSKELEQLNINHLLYNTGYLTIDKTKSVDIIKEYYLTYPNYEVRWSFTAYLLYYFYKLPYDEVKLDANRLRSALQLGDMPQAISLIRRFFSNIPHELRKNTDEAYYHALFQMLMMLIGVRIKSEESGSMGRADVVLRLPKKIYVIEFKHGKLGTMETLLNKAMQQIEENQYTAAFEGDKRRILKLAVGFLEKPRKGKVSELEIDYSLK